MGVSFQDDKIKNSEKVWQESGLFDDCRSDLTIPKANFPENTLCSVNQGSVSLVKGGCQAVYLEFAVCGQLMPVANPDSTIDLETTFLEKMRLFCMCSFMIRQQVFIAASKKCYRT